MKFLLTQLSYDALYSSGAKSYLSLEYISRLKGPGVDENQFLLQPEKRDEEESRTGTADSNGFLPKGCIRIMYGTIECPVIPLLEGKG